MVWMLIGMCSFISAMEVDTNGAQDAAASFEYYVDQIEYNAEVAEKLEFFRATLEYAVKIGDSILYQTVLGSIVREIDSICRLLNPAKDDSLNGVLITYPILDNLLAQINAFRMTHQSLRPLVGDEEAVHRLLVKKIDVTALEEIRFMNVLSAEAVCTYFKEAHKKYTFQRSVCTEAASIVFDYVHNVGVAHRSEIIPQMERRSFNMLMVQLHYIGRGLEKYQNDVYREEQGRECPFIIMFGNHDKKKADITAKLRVLNACFIWAQNHNNYLFRDQILRLAATNLDDLFFDTQVEFSNSEEVKNDLLANSLARDFLMCIGEYIKADQAFAQYVAALPYYNISIDTMDTSNQRLLKRMPEDTIPAGTYLPGAPLWLQEKVTAVITYVSSLAQEDSVTKDTCKLLEELCRKYRYAASFFYIPLVGSYEYVNTVFEPCLKELSQRADALSKLADAKEEPSGCAQS